MDMIRRIPGHPRSHVETFGEEVPRDLLNALSEFQDTLNCYNLEVTGSPVWLVLRRKNTEIYTRFRFSEASCG